MSDKYLETTAGTIKDLIETLDRGTDCDELRLSPALCKLYSSALRKHFPKPTPAPEGQKADARFIDLAMGVLEVEAEYECSDYGIGDHFYCPLCYAEIADPRPEQLSAKVMMQRIKHDEKCIYRIAQDLASPIAHPTPEPHKEPARIVASAIQIDGVIYTGLRHHQIIGYLVDAGFPTPIKGEQGFIDNTGQFLSRKDAAVLALKSGQVKKLIAPNMGLDSADVFLRKAPTEPEDAREEAFLAHRVGNTLVIGDFKKDYQIPEMAFFVLDSTIAAERERAANAIKAMNVAIDGMGREKRRADTAEHDLAASKEEARVKDELLEKAMAVLYSPRTKAMSWDEDWVKSMAREIDEHLGKSRQARAALDPKDKQDG